jgi:signal transduction histidine kinase
VPLVQDQVVRLSSIYGDRCDVEVNAEATIFGRWDLVEQMIQNLIGNALKYSMDRVLVRISENRFEVIDAGPGLPQAVVERFGLPFNIGPHKERFSNVGPRSTGLGLAWVVTICKLYNWTISHHREHGKTVLRVEF